MHEAKANEPPRPMATPKGESFFPTANRLLVVAAKGSWIVMKEVIKTAVRIPRWFVSINTPRPNDRQKGGTKAK